MSFWQHQPQSSQPEAPPTPSIAQIKELLLDYHGIMAEAIANLTIEDDEIRGYVKKGKYWYGFVIYNSAINFYA